MKEGYGLWGEMGLNGQNIAMSIYMKDLELLRLEQELRFNGILV